MADNMMWLDPAVADKYTLIEHRGKHERGSGCEYRPQCTAYTGQDIDPGPGYHTEGDRCPAREGCHRWHTPTAPVENTFNDEAYPASRYPMVFPPNTTFTWPNGQTSTYKGVSAAFKAGLPLPPKVDGQPYEPPPEHYAGKGMDPWAIWEAFDLDPWQANVVKYICRAGKKPGEDRLKDLKKAQNYLGYLIERAEKE